jgi:dTDP-4-dehydrorhamnose reductase
MSGRALVLGASGYVGGALLRHLGPARAVGTFHARPVANAVPFDALRDDLGTLVCRAGGDIGTLYILHGAVNPEACARDPAGTAAVNVAGVQRLLTDATARGIVPVFVSTDYVFDGTRGRRREDEPQCPNTEYGRQKAAVETFIQALPGRFLVARLSKVVGEEEGVHSVLGQLVPDIRKGATLRMATDQVFSPAHVADIARALAELPDRVDRGIVNVAGADAISRHDLTALLLAAIRRRDPSVAARLQAISLREVPFLEQRPLDTSLDTTRLHAMLPWRFRSMETVCAAIAERYETGG